MAKSTYIRTEAGGRTVLQGPDGAEIVLAGVRRMHFYRLTGVTPEEATDAQVERYLVLSAQEAATGERTTPTLRNESATDMVTRELGIINLPQVMAGANDAIDAAADQPAGRPPRAPFQPPTQQPQSTPAPNRSAALQPSPRQPSRAAERQGLPPPPRYQPGSETPPQPAARERGAPTPSSQAPQTPRVRSDASVDGVPLSTRFLRRAGPVLYIQTPDGGEQRVTQYMRVHFLRMLEKEIERATDEDIEMWWKLQGSLDAGATLQEAQTQSLLTEALKAAGKLKRGELEVLHQAVSAWLQARQDESG